jgi:hypothetical protein
MCAAMAEYRAGNYQATLEQLDSDTESRLSVEPRATAICLRAMARVRLGEKENARSELARAHALFPETSSPDAPVIESNTTIQDWLICQIIRREADALIDNVKK